MEVRNNAHRIATQHFLLVRSLVLARRSAPVVAVYLSVVIHVLDDIVNGSTVPECSTATFAAFLVKS